MSMKRLQFLYSDIVPLSEEDKLALVHWLSAIGCLQTEGVPEKDMTGLLAWIVSIEMQRDQIVIAHRTCCAISISSFNHSIPCPINWPVKDDS